MSEEEKTKETVRLLLKGDMELQEMMEFERLHKQAFRVAFDWLKACFPPKQDEKYWMETAHLLGKRANEHRDNPLVKHLLSGAYGYLGEIVKDLPYEEEEENEGNQSVVSDPET